VIQVGIEALNAFGGTAYLDVEELAAYRGLDQARFANLMMKEKAVALPHEDPVTYAVNAAKPIVDALSGEERDRIELVITCTESGIDFGKSMSTYVHDLLGLNRNCRLFEIKQACYSGTAGLQMAASFVLSQASPGAKALVIGTDISRFVTVDGGDALTQDWSYAEPSGGAGAVAMIVSANPVVFRLDVGANGYYGHEVMDTCRPVTDGEAGDAELSLLSYIDCCENAFSEYQKRVSGADYRASFQYLAFHTPFGGMVKGVHRTMMRKKTQAAAQEIEPDFTARVAPGLEYCMRVGNIMGGTVMLALASTIDNADIDAPRRIGCFSYGSGCCSEFFSGVASPAGQQRLRAQKIGEHLGQRYRLSMAEYETLLRGNAAVRFGTRNVTIDRAGVPGAQHRPVPRPMLVLRAIREFHREYAWEG
jgi:polyketide biosynthesis 3-hydroxy-3-methylglutaryl-CoA synthase-like enzyme PksG